MEYLNLVPDVSQLYKKCAYFIISVNRAQPRTMDGMHDPSNTQRRGNQLVAAWLAAFKPEQLMIMSKS